MMRVGLREERSMSLNGVRREASPGLQTHPGMRETWLDTGFVCDAAR